MPNLKLLFGNACAWIYHDYCYQCHFSTASFVSATIHKRNGAASHFCNETKHFVNGLEIEACAHTHTPYTMRTAQNYWDYIWCKVSRFSQWKLATYPRPLHTWCNEKQTIEMRSHSYWTLNAVPFHSLWLCTVCVLCTKLNVIWTIGWLWLCFDVFGCGMGNSTFVFLRTVATCITSAYQMKDTINSTNWLSHNLNNITILALTCMSL